MLDLIRRWRGAAWFLVLLPLIIIVISGDIGFYKEYAGRDRMSASGMQLFAARVTVVAMPIIALCLVESFYRYKSGKNVVHILSIVILLLFAGINAYIHGKRSIVAIFLFFLVISFFSTKVISRKSLATIVISSLIFFGVFLFSYGKNIDSGDGFLQALQGLRIDFSRDYSLKFVIYNELIDDRQVLPYKGASYLFFLASFIPRFFWEDKPYPYAVYFTNSFFGDFGGEQLYGWGLTTSFVSEAVSNLGWFGLIFFPAFYIFALKKIDRLTTVGAKIVGYMVMILLLAVQPIAILPVIVVFLMLILFKKKIVLKRRV